MTSSSNGFSNVDHRFISLNYYNSSHFKFMSDVLAFCKEWSRNTSVFKSKLDVLTDETNDIGLLLEVVIYLAPTLGERGGKSFRSNLFFFWEMCLSFRYAACSFMLDSDRVNLFVRLDLILDS